MATPRGWAHSFSELHRRNPGRARGLLLFGTALAGSFTRMPVAIADQSTGCSPFAAGSSGTVNCGPVIDNYSTGILFQPTSPLVLNVLQGTVITGYNPLPTLEPVAKSPAGINIGIDTYNPVSTDVTINSRAVIDLSAAPSNAVGVQVSAIGYHTLQIQNLGAITAAEGGLNINIDDGGGNINITNSGNISSRYAVSAYLNNNNSNTTSTATINNSGNLLATGPNFSFMIGAQVYDNVANAAVSNSAQLTANKLNAFGVYFDAEGVASASVAFVNSGTISTQNNSVSSFASGNAVSGIFSNSGTISSTSGSAYAINITTMATTIDTTTIANTGTITGLYGAIAVAPAGGNSPSISITNSGSVQSGGTTILTNDTPTVVTNSGVIASNAVAGTAISMGAGANRVTLEPGSSIIGFVLNGSTSGPTFSVSNNNVLALGGSGSSSFNVSQVAPSPGQLGYLLGGATYTTNAPVSDLVHQYQGFSGFEKTGDGVWTVTGTTTNNGIWTVQQGTLAVNGSLASSALITVDAGAIVSGSGTVGNTTIAGGTLAPGTAGVPGTFMTIGGNLVLQPGATYAVALNSSSSTYAIVSGTATLAGTVSTSFVPGSVVAHQYDILHSAGLGGTTFAGSTTNSPNFITSLSYTATDVLLNLTAALGNGTSLAGNQHNVAGAINGFFNSGGTPPSGLGTLFGLTGGSLSSALTQVTGETATGSQQTTFDAMDLFMGVLTDPFMKRNGLPSPTPEASGYADEASAYAATNTTSAFAMVTKAPAARTFEQRWSVWGGGFGGSQSTSGNAAVGSNNTTSGIASTAVGADYLVSPSTIAGVALAGGGTSFSVTNGGSGRSDLFQAGAYLRHTDGPAYITAALAYGRQDITTNRTVTVAGLDQLRAEFNANAYSGRLEGGYRLLSPATLSIGITPYAAAQFVTLDLPAYAEAAIIGSNNFALAYGAQDATDARTELGMRTDKSWATANGILTLRGRFAWAHDYDPNRSIAATFQTLPGASFVINGAAQAADSALATASIEMRWKSGWSAVATLEGGFSNITSSYAGKGVVRYQW